MEPLDIWRACERLASDKVRANPAGRLAGIVAGRFSLWLGREEKAGRIYTDAHRKG